jgi:hypothetical protein
LNKAPSDLLRDEVEAALAVRCHNYELSVDRTNVVLNGEFNLSDADGVYDTYKTQIIVPSDYPASEPVVFEMGGRIPRATEYHVNLNGTACVCVWEAWLATASDTSFGAYLDGPVLNFFLSQTIHEQKGIWPFGEEQHGREGVVSAFAAILQIPNDIDTVQRYLRVLSRDRLKTYWACPCGSGAKVSGCHRRELFELARRIPGRLAKRMLRRLSSQG